MSQQYTEVHEKDDNENPISLENQRCGLRMSEQRNVLICSGFDPLGGAGILADHRVASDFGLLAFAVPTTLVVQNTLGVRSSCSTDADAFYDAVKLLLEDVRVDAVKIGVVDNADVADALRQLLDGFDGSVVLDPVLSGGTDARPSIGGADAQIYRTLRHVVTVVTPNEEEAKSLLLASEDEASTTIAGMSSFGVAQAIAADWHVSVLQSGGHSAARGTDLLVTPDGKTQTFPPQSVLLDSDVHGTGCHLSTALAALLAGGYPLDEAVLRAKLYVEYLFATHEISPGRGRAQFYHDRRTESFARDLVADRV